MIINAKDLKGNDTFEDTVIIVGAGAAGISMACELEDRGIKVTLIESGGFDYDDEVQSLYKGFVDDSSPGALPH
jgi:flavin-dependent dehydrogenase